MEERVFKVLKLINEDICSYQGSKMLEDKIIDSFEIMQIISDLEEEFNMEIDAENIIVENFKNAQSVIDMMKRCIMEE
jgi:acyl carrier protein